MSNGDDAQDVFRRIYDTHHWEGGSGQGSRPDVTAAYRQTVESLLGAADIRSVVDAGCGDWEFAQLVDWTGVSYLGVDVVPEVVDANTAAFGDRGVRFACMDLAGADLPAADLLLCKDVLQHWPLARIAAFLAVTKRYRYALITNDVTSVHSPPEEQNTEINLGEWRTVDLERPPFAVNPAWRRDFDIRGEWTKRMLLLVRPSYRWVARLRPGSGLARLRRLGDS